MKSAPWLLVYVCVPAFASFCGQSTIPFSFQVLSNGQPVLGCARPSCFGWNANGERAADSPWFYRIAKQQDGFLRKSDIGRLQKIAAGETYTPQISDCDDDYRSSSCDGDDEWVGGIGASTNIPKDRLKLRCCKYHKLKGAWERGAAVVSPGEVVIGGEVARNGRQYAFDYVANVGKRIQPDGNVSYEVTIRRFACLPPFTEGTLKVDSVARSVFKENADVSGFTITEESLSEKGKAKSLPRRSEEGDDEGHAFEMRSRFSQGEKKRKVKVVYVGTPEYDEIFRRLRQQVQNAKRARAKAAQIHQLVTSGERYSPSKPKLHATEIVSSDGQNTQQLPNIRATFGDVQQNGGNTQNFIRIQPITSSSGHMAQPLPELTPPTLQNSLLPLPQTQHLFPNFVQQQPPVTLAPSLPLLFPQPLQQPLLFGLPQHQQSLWSRPQLQLPGLLQPSDPNRAFTRSPLNPLAIVP